MEILQHAQCFQLDHHFFFDLKIDPAGADFLITVVNLHFKFALECQTLLRHFNGERPLIDDFLKAVANGGMHFHGGSDDLAGNVGIFIFLSGHRALIVCTADLSDYADCNLRHQINPRKSAVLTDDFEAAIMQGAA